MSVIQTNSAEPFIKQARNCLEPPEGFFGELFFTPDYSRAAEFYELAAELSVGDEQGDLYEEAASCWWKQEEVMKAQLFTAEGHLAEIARIDYKKATAHVNAAKAYGNTKKALKYIESTIKKFRDTSSGSWGHPAVERLRRQAIIIHRSQGNEREAWWDDVCIRSEREVARENFLRK